jgi:ABC-type branched-subunit amino acid transport system substrate-binding protein
MHNDELTSRKALARARRRRAAAALALLGTLAFTAGCGARLDEQQLKAASGANGVGGPQQAGSVDGAGTGDGAESTGAQGAAEATPAGATPTTAAAAGAATGGQAAAGAPATGTCPSGGPGDVGVTNSEITIGNVSTISGPVPGLGQTAQNGVKAYVNYINSKGGVCGRKLKFVGSDDRLDTGTNRSETQRLAKSAFAIVGSFSTVDDGGASVLSGTNVPDVGLSLTDQRKALPNNFSTNPAPPGAKTNGTTNMMKYFHGQGVNKAAIVYAAQSTSRSGGLAYEPDMTAAGMQVVLKSEVAITQTDYTGVATQIKNAGADMVITTLEVGGMAKLAQALKQQNYKLKVPFYGGQAYSKKFLQQAGAAAEGTTLGVTYSPMEDAPMNPAVATFQQWYNRTAPGADIDLFAIQSWAATDMLVQAINKAGAPNRDKVLAALKTFTKFDANGLVAPINPAGKQPTPCFMVVAVEGGKWVRKFPAKGFQC